MININAVREMRTKNPALGSRTFTEFTDLGDTTRTMSIQGTVNKTVLMLLLIMISTSWTWNKVIGSASSGDIRYWMWSGILGSVAVALATIFNKRLAPVTAPIYSLVQGLFLGAVSAKFETMHQGIVVQAVFLTFSTLFILLAVYKARVIKVTQKFKLGVVVATGGIVLFYSFALILGFFGMNWPFFYQGGLLSIAFSLFVVALASFNLVLDFDFIENGVSNGAPKYMEWYSAFALMVTLVWLYVEFLRLLGKLRGGSK